ncbi:ABC transporter permease [Dactylosporangium sp. CA-233914]|uniref:ABC transporter permease n=1 Tax=Dactylosporangium sp. CA-233914 TaxID=3239934 RepID=UPI003D9067CE
MSGTERSGVAAHQKRRGFRPAPERSGGAGLSRILAVARLQALGRRDAALWPIGVLAIAFSVNVLLFATMPDDALESDPVTGALASIYIAALAFGTIAVNQNFPFALGMSVTRREFTAALALFAAVQVIAYSVLLIILQSIEEATGGWGLRLRFFGVGFIHEYPIPVQFVIYAVPMLTMTLIGTASGALYLRWRANGILTAGSVLLLLLGGAAALISRSGEWPAIGHWLTHTSPVALIAGWPLLLAAALGGGSWLVLRRATP